MKKIIATFVVAAAIALATQIGPQLAAPLFAETIRSDAIYMIDGDTADIDGVRYRLVGYDTPETYQAQCDVEKAWGNQATARARELITGAGAVDVIVLPGKDRYGRGLARMFIGNQNLGDILIAENLARAYDGGQRAGWC